MSTLEIVQVPVLQDNYLYLIHDPVTGSTAAIDPAVAPPARDALAARGWTLTHILNTHHHWDHIGANLELKEETGCTIVGPAADAERIPGIDVQVEDGERYALGDAVAKVYFVPGHTRGHIAYHFADSDALFCGDTIFSIGCGRLFEGSPAQMWKSISTLRALPGETRIYCAHEYTTANLRFALSVEPDHPALNARNAEVIALRAEGRPTVPSTIAMEQSANPFFRADDPVLQRAVGMEGADPARVFAEVRGRKDNF
ncbi:MAG: hydroxyacylglutathione hydrolase [Myxococcota bacterium]